MGDEQIGQTELGLEVAEQIQNLGLDGHVEGAGCLVAHQKVRLDRQTAGNPDPLALAARKLVGVAVDHVRVETNLGQEVLGPLFTLGAVVANAVGGHAFRDDFADHHALVERRIGILKHDLQPPPIGV